MLISEQFLPGLHQSDSKQPLSLPRYPHSALPIFMLQGEPDNSDNYLQQHYSLQMNSGSCKRAQNSIIKASFTPNIISVLTESWSFVIVKNSSVCEELFIQDFVWSGSILLILLQMFKVRSCVNCY